MCRAATRKSRCEYCGLPHLPTDLNRVFGQYIENIWHLEFGWVPTLCPLERSLRVSDLIADDKLPVPTRPVLTCRHQREYLRLR